MCGICGYMRFKEPISSKDEEIVKRMNDKLHHRGPDAKDTLVLDNIALGFSRLSIIGLSNGMQPLYNEDQSIVLICNGEIFNYIELREGLRKKGHIFQTDSDVEVIIHMYEEYGMTFLNDLNGQFAFTLYDTRKKTLFCARDQMGIIPFFYTNVNNTFIFGSEIKAILEHPLVKPEVDMVGLDQVFTFAGLISPRTMFKDISSLENGHYLTVTRNGDIEDKEYWDLTYPEGEVKMNGKPEQYYADRLEELFEESIKLRLRTDVPLGYYLSGGLDSSMIAMKMNKFNPSGVNEAFSIDFVESQLSESIYQQLAADESNSQLNQKVFFYDDISNRLPSAIYHCECPIKESYNTASLSLSKSVRDRGVKVILSGEGSDELFAGYVGYRFDKMRAAKLGEDAIDPVEQKLREQVWGDKDFFYETNFSELSTLKRQLFSDSLTSSYDDINCLNHFVVDKQKIENKSTINKRSYLDYKLRLVDHLVSDHGDRMALANSVEVRYPFLDKNFVEFSTTVPADLKLNNFTEKYILKKMARSFVPQPIVEREKYGFVAPGSPYLLKKDIEYVNDFLSYDLIKKQGIFNPDEVETLKKKYSKDGFRVNVPFENDMLMIVLTLGIFMDTFMDQH